MPAEFTQGFFVRVPAWHGMGVVLDDYPGREEAMRLAGHDWDVVEVDGLRMPVTNDLLVAAGEESVEGVGVYRKVEGWKAHLRSDNLHLLHVSRDSYERIPNSVPYEFAEALLDQGFKYETGITLRGGALNALTLLLDEPFTVPGDDSEILPYFGLAWAHDGSASLTGNPTTIRRVCANTVAASEAEGTRNSNSFSIRHTKNWRDKIDEARRAIKGVRETIDIYREVAEELAARPVTPAQRDWFVSTIVGDRDGSVSRGVNVSSRVLTNVEAERAKVNGLFFGSTIPEAHKLTAYGLFLAGGEYFDHLRGYRTQDSYVKRTLLTKSSEKTNLRKTIQEALVAA